MTLIQVVTDITSTRKWYAIYPSQDQQTRLRVTAHRILTGKPVRPETINDFLALFGYRMHIETTVRIAKLKN